MKTKLAILLGAFLSISSAFAREGKVEQEFRSFLSEYEKGVTSRDMNFLERVMPVDYVFSGPSGKMTNRAMALKYFHQQRDNPDFKSNSLDHLNVKVHIVGNMAVVTNDWISVTSPIDSASAAPTTYKGRHTGVFEKRNGRWMVIAEHDSEQAQDDKWMVSGVEKAQRTYNELVLRLQSGRSYAELESSGEIATLSRLLADEYTYTNLDGEIFNKIEAMECYKFNSIKIETAEFLEQNVRAIENNAVIATGKIRYVGTDVDKPVDISERYTTTWAFYDGRWQITAHQASTVKR